MNGAGSLWDEPLNLELVFYWLMPVCSGFNSISCYGCACGPIQLSHT